MSISIKMPFSLASGTDDYIYFIKEKFYWIYSNQDEEVVDGPLEVSSQWTKCEGRQRIIPHKREKVYPRNDSDHKVPSFLLLLLLLLIFFYLAMNRG